MKMSLDAARSSSSCHAHPLPTNCSSSRWNKLIRGVGGGGVAALWPNQLANWPINPAPQSAERTRPLKAIRLGHFAVHSLGTPCPSLCKCPKCKWRHTHTHTIATSKRKACKGGGFLIGCAKGHTVSKVLSRGGKGGGIF